MKVSVIINARAGRSNGNLERIGHEVRQALSRCELEFLHPETVPEMHACLVDRVRRGTDYLMVCGGDGTLNVAIQPLMKLRNDGVKLPPLCPVPIGTANDLAREMNVSSRVSEAAKGITAGRVHNIDVIEIASRDLTTYMITNGGLGIPAETAARANRFRKWVHDTATCPNTKAHWKPVFKIASKLVRMTGERVYELIMAGVMTGWDRTTWSIELEFPNEYKITTRAPFIMISNQKVIAGKFISAPRTSNIDGTFNVLLVEGERLFEQTRSLLQIRAGRAPNEELCPSFETERIIIRALERPITFFGDGEILHSGARELSIRCLHPGLPIVIREPI